MMRICVTVFVSIVLIASHAEARTTVEAYAGRPFGVARLTVDVPPGEPLAPVGDDRFAIVEQDARVLYPVLQSAPVRRFLRGVLGMSAPRNVTTYFLFRGDEPLEVTFFAPEGRRIRIVPEPAPPRRHERLLEEWWREYTASYRQVARSGDYPLVVQNYLVTTLGRRLGLPIPERGPGLFRRDDVNRALGLLFGTESVRAAMQKDVLLGDVHAESGGEIADLPLPRPIEPARVHFPEPAGDVQIEPIAMHVPHECFYVRFGNFRNYLWVRDLAKQWGGDLANMIAVRSIDYHTNERTEQMLALSESALAPVLGPAVIQDVAIIGTDTFVREGAAVGILFHARNNFALANDIGRQRREALDEWDKATDEKVRIAGRDVSYLSTPHGEIRSYYVQDGDFHFVTTSRYLARRFIEAGQGDGSLGGSAQFRYARSIRPATREDTVFAYLSDAFFRLLVSPQYRVEMTRRTRSLVEIENARIAPLAAWAEGMEEPTIADLIATGFLPRAFSQRADDSELIPTEDTWIDSVRGAPGYFRPIPDVEVAAVTPAEAAAYEEFRRVYEGNWQAVDPVIATIGRQPLDEAGRERITIELLVTPFHQGTYGWIANNLGPPARTRLAPVAGNVASLEAWIRVGGLLNPGGPKRVHHVFGGLRDFRSPLVVRQGDISWADRPAEFIRGYVGSSPPLRILDFFFPTDPAATDEFGYVPPRPPGDAWRRRLGEMAVFSFKRDVLENVTPQLSLVEAARPAQIRLRVDDLSDKAVSELVNAFGYRLARQASQSATHFINSLHQQLHVPRAESRAVAEELIGGTFVCPLGGEYELVEVPGGLPTWISTAVTPQNRWLLLEIPRDYQFPLLEWFRGGSAELTMTDTALQAVLQIDVQRRIAEDGEPDGGFQLPAFRLPFGGGAQEDEAPDAANERPDDQGFSEEPPPPPPVEDLPPPLPDR